MLLSEPPLASLGRCLEWVLWAVGSLSALLCWRGALCPGSICLLQEDLLSEDILSVSPHPDAAT